MFELLAVAIAIVGGTICGIYDLKTTNMLDWLAVLMIGAGFAISAAESFVSGSLTPIIFSLSVAGGFFLFGYGMYKAGYWGGGDGELLIAMGALVPVSPFVPAVLGLYGFSFSFNFLINSFIVGGVYSILYAGVLAARDRKIRVAFAGRVNDNRKIILGCFLVVSAFGLFFMHLLPLFMYISLGLLMAMPVLYIFAKTVEDVGFYKRISVSKLQVDDMIGEDLPKLGIFKKEIRGLTEDEVKKIRKSKKYVIVREGVRYSPVFVISLVFTILFGGFFGF